MQSEPKNPNQLDLELPGTEFAEKLAAETSDVAKLSAEVLEKGLVREQRPVFVYDKTLAKAKQGNALRQEKFRVEREKQGLKTGLAPIEVLEKVKELGGGADGWAKFLALAGEIKEGSQVTGNGVSVVDRVEVIKEIFVDRVVEKLVEVEVIKEVFVEKIVEVPGPVVEVLGPTVYKEKTVIQHDLKLRPDQKEALKIGEKLKSAKGWRAAIARKLLGW